jgi:hypothetical protein
MVIVFALLFFISTINAQPTVGLTLYSDGHIEEDLKHIPLIVNYADSIRNNLFAPMDIFNIYKNKNAYYIIFSEFNYVFRYVDNSITQLYKGNVHGYNFGRINFFKNDTLFSFGGAGFWMYFPDITFFNFESGFWEKYEVLGKKPFYDGATESFIFRDSNKINIYYYEKNPFSLNGQIETINSNRAFQFDFKNLTWKSHQYWDHLPRFSFHNRIETKNFAILYHNEFVEWIFDKRDLKVYKFSKFHKKFGFRKHPLGHKESKIIAGDVIYFLNHDFKISRVVDIGSDFDALDKDQYLFKRKPFLIRYWWTVIVFILLAWLALVIRKFFQLYQFPILPLLFKTGQSLQQEEIDQIFSDGFSDNEDDKRKTRAEKIDFINTYYSRIIAIERIKNPYDKRIFIYDIRLHGSPLINNAALYLVRKFH